MSVSKVWPELATSSGTCNHRKFAREPTSHTPPDSGGSERLGEVRRRRQARSAHAIEASALRARPRWRPPEGARDLRPHGVLRRRAGEVCRFQALRQVTALLTALLLAPHRLVGLGSTRSLLCQVPVGSTAPLGSTGQSAALHHTPALRAHAHTARPHTAYAQLSASCCHRAYVLSS